MKEKEKMRGKKVDKKSKRSRKECPIRNGGKTGVKRKKVKFKNVPGWSASYVP